MALDAREPSWRSPFDCDLALQRHYRFTPAEGHILRQTGARRVIMATRIGVLVPAGNPTVEPELYRMAPASVTLHFARLDGGEGTPGAHVGMERRLLVYLDSLPAVLPTLAAVQPAV